MERLQTRRCKRIFECSVRTSLAEEGLACVNAGACLRLAASVRDAQRRLRANEERSIDVQLARRLQYHPLCAPDEGIAPGRHLIRRLRDGILKILVRGGALRDRQHQTRHFMVILLHRARHLSCNGRSLNVDRNTIARNCTERSRIAARSLHRNTGSQIAGGELDLQVGTGDHLVGHVDHIERKFFADLWRCLLRHNGNASLRTLRVGHAEVICRVRLVAVQILEIDRKRMLAVAQVQIAQIERARIDLSVCRLVDAVNVDARRSRIDAAGIFVGRFAVGVVDCEVQRAPGHLRLLPVIEHRIGRRLRHRLDGGVVDVVRVGAVDELDIVDQNVCVFAGILRRAAFCELTGILRRNKMHRIAAIKVDRHLHTGNIGFHPNPAAPCHVAQCAENDSVAFLIHSRTVILRIHRHARRYLTFDKGKCAVRVQLIVAVPIHCAVCTTGGDDLQDGIVILARCRNVDPHTDLGRLLHIDQQVTGIAEICGNGCCSAHLVEVIRQLIRTLAKAHAVFLPGHHAGSCIVGSDSACSGANPQTIFLNFIRAQLPAVTIICLMVVRTWFYVGIPVVLNGCRCVKCFKVKEHQRFQTYYQFD